MTAIDVVFQAVFGLTGGLITDVQTAVIGIVTLAFIAMGLDILKDLLLGAFNDYRSEKAANKLWASVNNKGEDWEKYKKDYNLNRAKRRFDKFDMDL